MATKAKAKAKAKPPARTVTEVRDILLQYFYGRYKNATSARGKRGFAVKVKDIRADLKASHALSQTEVVGNLLYLMSQGWLEEDPVEKSFTAPSGTVMPSTTVFYKITAAGIDKIEGTGTYTMRKFHDIKIEATGQNIITLGDGNQVNAKFGDLGQALADLRDAIAKSEAPEAEKLNVVADIESIQTQLAKPQPNKGIIAAAWSAIKGAGAVGQFVRLMEKTGHYIGPFIP